MIAHYFTLKTLAEDWNTRFRDGILGDVYAQNKGELILAMGTKEADHALLVQTNPGRTGIFRVDGYNRAKRNVLTRFEQVIGQAITEIKVADRDRFILISLENGWKIQLRLFGPHANAYLLNKEGVVADAFKAPQKWVGKPAPEMRPAEEVGTFTAFSERWQAASGSKTWVQQLRRILPFMDEGLSQEVFHRLGGAWHTAPNLAALFDTSNALLCELSNPKPCLYWDGDQLVAFSLIPLQHLAHLREEVFPTTDAAVRVYWRRFFAQYKFRRLFDPLYKALNAATEQLRHRTEQVLEEVSRPSRAVRYEKWAHLLMAQANTLPKGHTEIVLPDLFEPDHVEVVKLDSRLNGVENAQYYYEKARKTRQARLHAEERWTETEALATKATQLLLALTQLNTAPAVEQFQLQYADHLIKLVGHQHMGQETLPFRRFMVSGYEVWVGRNARENDLLTFRYAQKHDLWLHARGVAGSHVLLRRQAKNRMPPKLVLEQTAAIAAYFSQAKSSSLAPVIYTERKYVRKARKGPPGAVLVEREQVLLVVPDLPENTP